MEIITLLTILLITLLLGGLHLQGGVVCLIESLQKGTSIYINYMLKNSLSQCAVKLVLRCLYMLNTVMLFDAQKATQTTLNQPQNLKFEG